MLDNLFEQAFNTHRDVSTKPVNESLDADYDFNAQYINDDYDGTVDANWKEVASKSVLDEDGNWTDYTLYKGISPSGEDIWICMFGDKDLYPPELAYADTTFDLEDNAKQHFEDFIGFDDEIISQFATDNSDYGDEHFYDDEDEYANIYGGDRETCIDCGSSLEWDEDGFSYCPNCNESVDNFSEGIDSNYFKKFEDILDEYVPANGEGTNLATQSATAVNKLIYKWYNDGDVYDNNYYLKGWYNDLSSYANWLNEYVAGSGETLEKIEEAKTDEDYEFILKQLADFILTEANLEALAKLPKQGSIYDCGGPYSFSDDDEDDEYEELDEAKHSYGGAFDIEDDQLFTKDELMEFANDIIESLASHSQHRTESFDIADLYVDNDYLTIKILFKPEELEEEVTIKLDYRRARSFRALERAYLKQFVDEFIDKFEKDGITMSIPVSGQDYPLDEAWSENNYNAENMEYVRKVLEDTSPRGYKYVVKNIYIDYGADWMEYTIICYGRDGRSWQVLSPREIKDINDATSTSELDGIIEEIKHDKYFQDKDPNLSESIDTGKEYWYFTTHGVMPGSVPKGIDILDIVDYNNGSYFKTNKLLTTDELNRFDIKERVPENTNIFKEEKSLNNTKCFVTEYEEYPIYEPAEGGYYYAGNEVVFSQEFDSFDDALEYFKKNANDYISSDFKVTTDDVSDDELLGLFNKYKYIIVASRHSKYIGEDSTVVIEKEKGSQESGKHAYESVQHNKNINEAYCLNETDDVFKYDMDNLATTLYNLLNDRDNNIDITYLSGNFKGAEFILSYNDIDKKIFAKQLQNGEVEVESKDTYLKVFGKKPSELVDAIFEYAKTFNEEDDD